MNAFDKVCAALAFLLGAVFILLGAIGLFTGANASFTLPPILGVLPVFFGWGIVKPIVVAWKAPPPAGVQQHAQRAIADLVSAPENQDRSPSR